MNSESLEDLKNFVYGVILAEKSLEEQMKFYAENADIYDQSVEKGLYRFPEILSEEFATFALPYDVKILDVGAGTGRNGGCLRTLGYFNVDALDGCDQMLHHAKQRNYYKNYIQALVVKDKELPIPENSYDVALMAGSASPAHIDVTAYKQIIRVVKPGGIIGWIIENAEIRQMVSSRFRDDFYRKTLDKFVDDNLWVPIEDYQPKSVPDAGFKMPADVYFYKVL